MIEWIDLYDQNKVKINRVVDRNSYEFQPGEFMMYVLAILENQEGKFLITQRSMHKKWAAGQWEVPGGGAKKAETSLEAIQREVKEETGLDVRSGKIVYSYFNEDNKRHDNYFVDIYHFKMDFEMHDIKLNPNESIDCKFVTLEELNLMNKEQPVLHFERIMKSFTKNIDIR